MNVFVHICSGLVAALLLSFIYVFLLRWIAGPMVFLGIFLAILLSVGGECRMYSNVFMYFVGE